MTAGGMVGGGWGGRGRDGGMVGREDGWTRAAAAEEGGGWR